MGNYIFTTKVLVDAIRADADEDDSDHDMGGDIIPRLVRDGMAAVYDFNDNEVPGATERDHGYWRDVGTLDAFYDAHMDLVSVHPVFNLYNRRWPIRGEPENLAPAKFVNGGSAQESVVGAGSIVSAASVRNSVLSSNVVIDDGAIVEGSVLMPGVRIGRGAVVRHAILDKNVVVGPGEMVGVDLEQGPRTVRDQRRRRGRRRQGHLDLTAGVAVRRFRRRSSSHTAAQAISATTTSTSAGSRIATNTNPTLVKSSTVLKTGAATPAVATLATGRTAVFVRCTTRATTTPIAIGTHWPDVTKAPGSVTAAVCDAVPEPKTMPPAVGRTKV